MYEKIVQLNERAIKGRINEAMRDSVEETLCERPEAESQKLTQTARYQMSEGRQPYRNGQ